MNPKKILLVLLIAMPLADMTYAGWGGSRSGGRSASRPAKSSWGSASRGGYTSKGSVQSDRRQVFMREKAIGNGVKPSSVGRQASASRQEKRRAYEQRYSQPTTVINNHYHNTPRWGSWGWGFGSVGIWDLFFLSTVNHLFWYHHWHDPSIQRALYQENMLNKEELHRLEQKVAELERQGVSRDPKYLPPDVDPEAAYAKEQQQEATPPAAASEASTPAASVAPALTMDHQSAQAGSTNWSMMAFLALLGFGGYFLFFRRY